MNTFYACPADCSEEVTLPALPTDPYCIQPPDYSQVGQLIITPCDAPDPFVYTPAGGETPASVDLVSGEIDNTAIANEHSKLLVGQGGVADHEPTIYDAPFRGQIISNRSYTLEFQVSLGDQLTYEFLQAVQCNYRAFRFWYVDISDWLHGTVNESGAAVGGIRPSFVNVQMPKGAGRDDLQTANVLITWESNSGDPFRYRSPLVSGGTCEPPPA